jgi:hypothetical protein
MFRWDTIVLFLLFIVLLHTGMQVVEVWSTHGPILTGLYERTFSPGMRPILKLELLLLGAVILFRLWTRTRPRDENSEKMVTRNNRVDDRRTNFKGW